MADNLNVTEGSGKVLASDDIGGVHYPKEKVCFGAADSVTMVAATAGSAMPIEGVSGGQAVPVSAASLPLPSGASTAAKQPALGVAGTASSDVITVQGISGATAVKVDGSAVTQPVSDGGGTITVDGTVAFSNTTIAVTNAGTFATQAVCTNAGTFAVQATQAGTWNVTNISGTVSLPTGAATAAKQPALGTAGTASSDVLTVQGITSMTALKVDGSAVTQPVSGTVAFSNTTLAVTNAGTFATQAVCTNAGTFAVQAAQSGTWNVTNVSGTVSLPTGASTAAKQPALGTAGTASTDVITVQGITSMTALKVDGSAVTQPVSIASAVPITDNSGSITVDNGGTFAVQATLQAGTAGIGKLTSNTGVTIGAVELAASQTLATVTTVGTVTTITNAVTANLAPTTTGGCSMSSTLSSASSNTATSVKGSAGQLYGVYVSNTNASARWLKLYNSSSAPTAGSGTPVLRLLIPGNASGVAGAFEFSNGVAFSSGIGFTITGAVADNDTTAISANEVIVNILYK